MPRAGGAIRRLTKLLVGLSVVAGSYWLASLADAEGPTAKLEPMATPGARIAFVTSTEAKPESLVWTAAADGGERKLLGPGVEALISPNGATVAASLFGSGGLTESGPSLGLYPTSGGAPIQLGDLAHQLATPLAWSPDSRYLAVGLQSTAIKNVAANSDLAVLDTTTDVLKPVMTGIVYGASFAPDGSDRLVFGRSASQIYTAHVDLYSYAPNGTVIRVTTDGRSLNPIWGPKYIAYDRERLRHDDAPVYEIWLRGSSGRPRQLTRIKVRTLVSGLVPLGFSQSGSRLLAEFVGQDTSEAWTVQVASGRARAVRIGRRNVVGGAISADGSHLLVAEGGLDGPASQDNVVTVPFSGGPAKLLVAHAAEPSWTE
jgi:hypothetical protein